MNRIPYKGSPEPGYIYGRHAVDMAIERRPEAVQTVYVSPKFSNERVLAKIRRLGVSVEPLNDRRLPERLPNDTNHQGLVAEINAAALTVPYQEYMREATITADSLFLLLAEVQDPQNVGAMIRSAAAFGVQAVLLPHRQQAPITGSVVKVSAGMAFAVPLVQIKNVNTTIADLSKRGVATYGLVGEGAQSIHATDFAAASVLVVGNEGAGLREKTREICDALIQIPMHPRCESLNAASAVTASLAIWSAHHPGAVVSTK